MGLENLKTLLNFLDDEPLLYAKSQNFTKCQHFAVTKSNHLSLSLYFLFSVPKEILTLAIFQRIDLSFTTNLIQFLNFFTQSLNFLFKMFCFKLLYEL